jgi:hypothetical protein
MRSCALSYYRIFWCYVGRDSLRRVAQACVSARCNPRENACLSGGRCLMIRSHRRCSPRSPQRLCRRAQKTLFLRERCKALSRQIGRHALLDLSVAARVRDGPARWRASLPLTGRRAETLLRCSTDTPCVLHCSMCYSNQLLRLGMCSYLTLPLCDHL